MSLINLQWNFISEKCLRISDLHFHWGVPLSECYFFLTGNVAFWFYAIYLKAVAKWSWYNPELTMDYSLPGLTQHNRLRIVISQLSIPGIVVRDSVIFPFALSFLLLLLFFFFNVFMFFETLYLFFICEWVCSYYLKYLALKASQLRQTSRRRGTLTQTVAALRLLLSDWVCVQKSTVGWCEQLKNDVKKH